MKEKLLCILNKAKELGSKHPFLAGLMLGYLGKPAIELAINASASLVKIVLG